MEPTVSQRAAVTLVMRSCAVFEDKATEMYCDVVGYPRDRDLRATQGDALW